MVEVAERAGVSQTTVSRVVNGDGRVAECTAAVVRGAMAELGYEPRPRRRSGAKAGFSGGEVLGLLMLDDSMDTHPSLALAKLRGVVRAAKEAGVPVCVARLGADGECPAELLAPNVRGVLLWGNHEPPSSVASELARRPHLWISSHRGSAQTAVLEGNEQAGRLAAEHLLDIGCRHPAILHCFPENHRLQARVDGFRYACHLRGCEARVLAQPTGDGHAATLRISGLPGGAALGSLGGMAVSREVPGLVDQLAGCEPRPDGLFLPDDQLVPATCTALKRNGLTPQSDVTIVGCGNEWAYLNALVPRPATIDLAPEATGRLAVELLLRRVRHPEAADDPVSLIVTPRLIAGE